MDAPEPEAPAPDQAAPRMQSLYEKLYGAREEPGREGEGEPPPARPSVTLGQAVEGPSISRRGSMESEFIEIVDDEESRYGG
jgi:hypothetical protein